MSGMFVKTTIYTLEKSLELRQKTMCIIRMYVHPIVYT